MKKSQDPFCCEVVKKITYIQSSEVSAIVSASNYLVQFGHRAVGKCDSSFLSSYMD